jgi:putative peptide zinc metalloprotease protein
VSAAGESLVLVLPNGMRYPVLDYMTIGRADEATVRIDDRTVSRTHARIDWSPEGPMIADAGSRFGTLISGQKLEAPRRLLPGQEIRLGNVTVRVEGVGRPAGPLVGSGQPYPPMLPGSGQPGFGPTVDDQTPPNATMVVPIGATQAGMRAPALPSTDGALRPRLRSGWALKRLEDEPGQPERYVLRDLVSGTFRRLDAVDAKLLPLLDGRRTVTELLVEAENVGGPSGAGRLARLIADFGERGMLDGVEPTPEPPASSGGLLGRAFKRRDRTIDGLPDYFQTAYRHWGRALFSPLSVTFLVLLSFAGLFVFSYLVGARYGTPLVVAHRLAIGGAVFLAGRFVLVCFHELAHGLTLAHYGRRAGRSGFRLLFIFPYAFVDSSEAYFETRAHRIWISLAGPLSDLSIAALFSIACAVAPRGSVREVLFQLAFAGYVGAFFNLNPFLDRDGYQVLVEWLREPGLKQRARQQLRQRLTGRVTGEHTSPVLMRYATAGLVWTAIGGGVIVAMSLRYYNELIHLFPRGVVIGGFIAFVVILLSPIFVALVVPLFHRARYGSPEVNRVVQ